MKEKLWKNYDALSTAVLKLHYSGAQMWQKVARKSRKKQTLFTLLWKDWNIGVQYYCEMYARHFVEK